MTRHDNCLWKWEKMVNEAPTPFDVSGLMHDLCHLTREEPSFHLNAHDLAYLGLCAVTRLIKLNDDQIAIS